MMINNRLIVSVLSLIISWMAIYSKSLYLSYNIDIDHKYIVWIMALSFHKYIYIYKCTFIGAVLVAILHMAIIWWNENSAS